MDERERGLLFLGTVLFIPLFVWFVVANAYYGIDKDNVNYLLIYLVKNTFSLWPLWSSLIFGFILGIAIFAGVLIFDNSRVYRGQRFVRFLRGTKLVRASQLKEKTFKRGEQQLTIASIPIPIELEPLHFSIGGATGTGKSTIFNELLFGMIKRGDKRVILDPNGSYLKNFYLPGDKILNSYDARTEGWSFFNEIRNDYDYERYVKSIVQESPDQAAEEWYGYGRLIFSEVSRKLHSLKYRVAMKEVMHYCCIVEQEDLRKFLKGTAAEAIFTGSNERAVGSARFTLSKKLTPHLRMPDGDFSIREWLEDDTPGTLFITWQEEMRDTLNPLISCWLDSIFSIVLGMGENPEGKIKVMLDELESLAYLPNLNDALTKGRKSGLSVFAGYQTYSQLVKVYGREMASTLLSNMRNVVIHAGGRLGDDTLEQMSKSLGEIEGEVLVPNEDSGKPGWGTRKQRQTKTARAVTTTEIAQLKNLHGYLALAGDYPVAKFKNKHMRYERKSPVEGIVLRN